jgi:hypothetical protein
MLLRRVLAGRAKGRGLAHKYARCADPRCPEVLCAAYRDGIAQGLALGGGR